MFRYGLTAALATTDRDRRRSSQRNGTELLDLVARAAPDVILTDLAMPGMDGTTATSATHISAIIFKLQVRDRAAAVAGARAAGLGGPVPPRLDSDASLPCNGTATAVATV